MEHGQRLNVVRRVMFAPIAGKRVLQLFSEWFYPELREFHAYKHMLRDHLRTASHLSPFFLLLSCTVILPSQRTRSRVYLYFFIKNYLSWGEFDGGGGQQFLLHFSNNLFNTWHGRWTGRLENCPLRSSIAKEVQQVFPFIRSFPCSFHIPWAPLTEDDL